MHILQILFRFIYTWYVPVSFEKEGMAMHLDYHAVSMSFYASRNILL